MWAAGKPADLFFLRNIFLFPSGWDLFAWLLHFPTFQLYTRSMILLFKESEPFLGMCSARSPVSAHSPKTILQDWARGESVCKWLVCVPWWTREHRNFNSPFCNPSTLSRGNLRRPTGNSSQPIFCPTRLSQNSDIRSTHCVFDSSALYWNFTKVDS